MKYVFVRADEAKKNGLYYVDTLKCVSIGIIA